MQIVGSPRIASVEHRGTLPGDLLLHKLEEVNKSVKVRTFSFLHGATITELEKALSNYTAWIYELFLHSWQVSAEILLNR